MATPSHPPSPPSYLVCLPLSLRIPPLHPRRSPRPSQNDFLASSLAQPFNSAASPYLLPTSLTFFCLCHHLLFRPSATSTHQYSHYFSLPASPLMVSLLLLSSLHFPINALTILSPPQPSPLLPCHCSCLTISHLLSLLRSLLHCSRSRLHIHVKDIHDSLQFRTRGRAM